MVAKWWMNEWRKIANIHKYNFSHIIQVLAVNIILICHCDVKSLDYIDV